MAGIRNSPTINVSSKISQRNNGHTIQSCGGGHGSTAALRTEHRWYIITPMVFEEDLTRDSLNRLIQRMDEELTMPDEPGKEEY
jgi:hypothetical protein